MPRVSAFYGIVIRMYPGEGHHAGRPHFHAEYADAEASFDIETLETIAGRLPRRAEQAGLEVGTPAPRGAAPQLATRPCRRSLGPD
jgi:hypothetical protein